MMASGSLRRLITVTSASWITRSITDFSVLRASEKLITLISFLCVYNLEYKNIEVPAGSMVIQAAHQLNRYIPHFCYHKKLSVAANCRMCLVEVEKMPKAV